MRYWYKGKIFTDQPFLTPSLSIQRADGVFESILTQNDKIFFFNRHIERMKKAAGKLGIFDFDETSIRAGANELVINQRFSNAHDLSVS
jgi:branched-subunit amino acid aminotransferase/4-amino-4-deoxychorismate lyase